MPTKHEIAVRVLADLQGERVDPVRADEVAYATKDRRIVRLLHDWSPYTDARVAGEVHRLAVALAREHATETGHDVEVCTGTSSEPVAVVSPLASCPVCAAAIGETCKVARARRVTFRHPHYTERGVHVARAVVATRPVGR